MSDDQTEITVRKLSWPVEIQLLGLDDQGRQLYRCPSAGCGETAYFDADGNGHCPTDEAFNAFLAEAAANLEQARSAPLDEPTGGEV